MGGSYIKIILEIINGLIRDSALIASIHFLSAFTRLPILYFFIVILKQKKSLIRLCTTLELLSLTLHLSCAQHPESPSSRQLPPFQEEPLLHLDAIQESIIIGSLITLSNDRPIYSRAIAQFRPSTFTIYSNFKKKTLNSLLPGTL